MRKCHHSICVLYIGMDFLVNDKFKRYQRREYKHNLPNSFAGKIYGFVDSLLDTFFLFFCDKPQVIIGHT